MTEVIVKTDEVVKEYRMGTNVVKALSGVNLEIYQHNSTNLLTRVQICELLRKTIVNNQKFQICQESLGYLNKLY